LIDAGCADLSTDVYIKMDIFTFLKNYDAFQKFIEAEVGEESRENASASFRAMKVVATSMLKAITNIRIQSPHSFFAADRASFAEIKAASSDKDFSVDRDNPFRAHDALEEELFLDMEKILLDTAK
jgi:hypothetical protein